MMVWGHCPASAGNGESVHPFCSILDGYSRFLVHWDLREAMTEADIEIILERAKEQYLGVKPRITSDNGPQFIRRCDERWWYASLLVTTAWAASDHCCSCPKRQLWQTKPSDAENS